MLKRKISVKSAKAKARRLQNRVTQDFSNITNIPWGRDQLLAARPMGQSGSDVILIGEAKKLLNVSVECKACEQWSVGTYIQQAQSNIADVSDWVLIIKKSNQEPIVLMDLYYITKLIDIIEDCPHEIFTTKRFYLEKWVNEVRDHYGKNKEWYCVIQYKNENYYFMEYKYYIKLLTYLVERRKRKISLLRRR